MNKLSGERAHPGLTGSTMSHDACRTETIDADGSVETRATFFLVFVWEPLYFVPRLMRQTHGVLCSPCDCTSIDGENADKGNLPIC